MDKKKEFIELLRHYRHDWLNVLQLIKGNLALNKLNRVEEIIREIVIHTENESKLSNLQIPKVAYYLITFNLCNHYFKLNYEIIGDVIDLSKYDESLYSWLQQFFQLLNDSCLAYNDNSLQMTFQLFKDDFRIIMDYEGAFAKYEQLVNWINNEGKNMDKLTVVENKLTNDMLIVEISLK